MSQAHERFLFKKYKLHFPMISWFLSQQPIPVFNSWPSLQTMSWLFQCMRLLKGGWNSLNICHLHSSDICFWIKGHLQVEACCEDAIPARVCWLCQVTTLCQASPFFSVSWILPASLSTRFPFQDRKSELWFCSTNTQTGLHIGPSGELKNADV